MPRFFQLVGCAPVLIERSHWLASVIRAQPGAFQHSSHAAMTGRYYYKPHLEQNLTNNFQKFCD